MRFLVALAFSLFLPAVAQCQDAGSRPVEVKGIAGWTGFVDESMLHHFVGGGSIRTYLTRRFSIDTEVLYMRGPGFDRDLVVIPNAAFDFGSSPRVRPYVIGGAGLLRHRDGLRMTPNRATFFWANSWTASAGFGVKIFLNERLFLSPEFRIGLEPHMRSTVGIGYRF